MQQRNPVGSGPSQTRLRYWHRWTARDFDALHARLFPMTQGNDSCVRE
jgi:hypothetical protein